MKQLESMTAKVCSQIELYRHDKNSVIQEEVIDRKHELKMMALKIHHLLTCSGLTNSTRRTQIETYSVLLDKKNGPVEFLRFDEIERKYWEIFNKRQTVNPKPFIRTKKEMKFYSALRSRTRSKIIRTFMLGRFLTDMYVISIGLMIEIDGEYHDKESKMIIDQFKMDLCSDLGVKFLSVQNKDLDDWRSSNTVKDFFDQINSVPRLNSTKRRKLLLSLMMFTIMVNDPEFIFLKLGISRSRLDELAIIGLDKMLKKYEVTEDKLKPIKVLL